MAPVDGPPTRRTGVAYALAAPWRYTNTPPLCPIWTPATTTPIAPAGGNESSGAADGAGCQAGSRHQHEHTRQNQEALRGLFMTMQRATRHDALDAVLLGFTALCGNPGTERQRCRDRNRYGPYPTRCSAFPDNPERHDHRDWKEHSQYDGEMHHQRVKRDAEHVRYLRELRVDTNVGIRGRRGYPLFAGFTPWRLS